MHAMPEGYRLRLADLSDIAEIVAIDRAASELFRPTGLIRNMPATPDSIPNDVLTSAIEAGRLTIADHDSDPIGFTLTQDLASSLYLDQVSVHPDHGRRGVGRALVEAVIRTASVDGYKDVLLSTFRDVPWNGPFYRSLGFQELKPTQKTSWMRQIEEAQTETMDVSLRCFMRRSIGLFERGRLRRVANAMS
ncbi:MAG: GNAT family N-acetyltransferase [Pseudomonadota bacterium]